jgi:hypothetical protein
MIVLDFCSGEVSPPVHHGLRLKWSGLIRGTLLIHPFALIRRVLDLVALNLNRFRRCALYVIVSCRPEEILQMCWVTSH